MLSLTHERCKQKKIKLEFMIILGYISNLKLTGLYKILSQEKQNPNLNPNFF